MDASQFGAHNDVVDDITTQTTILGNQENLREEENSSSSSSSDDFSDSSRKRTYRSRRHTRPVTQLHHDNNGTERNQPECSSAHENFLRPSQEQIHNQSPPQHRNPIFERQPYIAGTDLAALQLPAPILPTNNSSNNDNQNTHRYQTQTRQQQQQQRGVLSSHTSVSNTTAASTPYLLPFQTYQLNRHFNNTDQTHYYLRAPPNSPPTASTHAAMSTPTLPELHTQSSEAAVEAYRVERRLNREAFDARTAEIRELQIHQKLERGGSAELFRNEKTVELAGREDAEVVERWVEERTGGGASVGASGAAAGGSSGAGGEPVGAVQRQQQQHLGRSSAVTFASVSASSPPRADGTVLAASQALQRLFAGPSADGGGGGGVMEGDGRGQRSAVLMAISNLEDLVASRVVCGEGELERIAGLVEDLRRMREESGGGGGGGS